MRHQWWKITKRNKPEIKLEYIIVGLGNPGSRYRRTRHNVGFLVLDSITKERNARWLRDGEALTAEVEILGRQVLLVKPQTYMNLSGPAVKKILDKYLLTGKNMLVVLDDLDLPPGRIRFRREGGSGGHRGLASVIDALNTTEFPRLRVGIGRPLPGSAAKDFVLEEINPGEWGDWLKTVDLAAQAVEFFIGYGLDAAMNQYNNTGG